MNTNENNREHDGLNATDFLGSYLKKEDLNGETTVNLIAVRADEMPNSTRRKLVAEFAEFEKPLILNSTNTKRLMSIFSSRNTAHWRGTVSLYVDDSVEYGGRTVGGIRVKEATPNGRGEDDYQAKGRQHEDVPF